MSCEHISLELRRKTGDTVTNKSIFQRNVTTVCKKCKNPTGVLMTGVPRRRISANCIANDNERIISGLYSVPAKYILLIVYFATQAEHNTMQIQISLSP